MFNLNKVIIQVIGVSPNICIAVVEKKCLFKELKFLCKIDYFIKNFSSLLEIISLLMYPKRLIERIYDPKHILRDNFRNIIGYKTNFSRNILLTLHYSKKLLLTTLTFVVNLK